MIFFSDIETPCTEKENGWLIVFYGISTLIGYLMTNPVYTYTLDIYNL